MKVLWQQIASPTITEILCNSKFDGVVLDLEHGCFNSENIYSSIQIASLMKKKSFIRVTSLDKTIIRMALDAGVSGVIMSTVESGAQAVEFVGFCRYPPYGCRGQGLNRENNWGEKNFEVGFPTLVAQIETKQGVDEISEISKSGVDYFMVGPYDLSASLRCLGNFDSEIYKEYVNRLTEYVGEKFMGYHFVKDIGTQYNKYEDCGFLAFSMDTMILTEGINYMEEQYS